MASGMARFLVQLLAIYFLIGFIFSLAFVVRGVSKIDRNAAGSSIGFRLIILPGSAALWPLLLVRWLRRAGTPPAELNAHDRAARASGGQEKAP